MRLDVQLKGKIMKRSKSEERSASMNGHVKMNMTDNFGFFFNKERNHNLNGKLI